MPEVGTYVVSCTPLIFINQMGFLVAEADPKEGEKKLELRRLLSIE